MAGSATVAKVGGSLYDLPDLRQRLGAWLRSVGPRVLLVPGGGPTADAIRDLDRIHHLGEEAAHWLALQALTVNAHFLAALLPNIEVVDQPSRSAADGWSVLDAHAFARLDEGRPGCLPHLWDVTSDSVAARVAQRVGGRLVLLKSVSWESNDWEAAARAGVVDARFASLVGGRDVTVVNLRTWSPA